MTPPKPTPPEEEPAKAPPVAHYAYLVTRRSDNVDIAMIHLPLVDTPPEVLCDQVLFCQNGCVASVTYRPLRCACNVYRV